MQNHINFKPKKILVTLTGGGFLWQAQSLLNHLGNDYEYNYVTVQDSIEKAKTINIPKGEIHNITKIASMGDKSFIKILENTIISLKDAYRVVKKVNPCAVICVGTSLAVPLCLWAKYFGNKAIFVESITRVSKPSLTGKILSTLRLCDRFYVQWPEAVKLYRGAIYRGRVL